MTVKRSAVPQTGLLYPQEALLPHKEAEDRKAIWSLPFSTDAGHHKN